MALATTTRRRATKKAAPEVKFVIEVDERTEHMPDQALACRLGHTWIRVAVSADRRDELEKEGLDEIFRVCSNKCGHRWSQIREIRTGKVVKNTRTCTDPNYGVKKGQGRLSKDEAYKALYVREHPRYRAA